MAKKDCDPKIDFLNTEYTAVSAYFNQVINFRFTSFGFFIAIIGFLFSQNLNQGNLKYWVILIMTIIVWMIELRNRNLASQLMKRAKEIENFFFTSPKTENEIQESIKNNENSSIHFFHSIEEGQKDGGKPKLFGIPMKNPMLYCVKEKEEQKIVSITFNKDCEYQCMKNKLKEDNLEEKPYRLFLFSHSFIMDAAYSGAIIITLIMLVFK
jgi:hypothetical protein